MSLESVMNVIVKDNGKTAGMIVLTAGIATGAYLFLACKFVNYYMNRKQKQTYQKDVNNDGENHG